jgi:hypothetical protein
MAPKLISTLGEVQEHVPVAMTSSFSVVAPYLVSAERTYIRKLIGEAQYSAWPALAKATRLMKWPRRSTPAGR